MIVEITYEPDVAPPPRRFVPDGFDGADRRAVEALATGLIARPQGSAAAFEAWVLDWSDLARAFRAVRTRRRIAMTRDTEDAAAREAFLAFERDLVPVAFELRAPLADQGVVVCRLALEHGRERGGGTGAVAAREQKVAKMEPARNQVRRQRHRAREARGRALGVAKPGQADAEIVVRLGEVGRQRERGAELLGGRGIVAALAPQGAEVVVRVRIIRVGGERLTVGTLRRLAVALAGERDAEIVARLGRARVGLDRTPIMRHRLVQRAVVGEQDAEIVVRLGKPRGARQCRPVMRARLVAPAALGAGDAEPVADHRIVRIELQRPAIARQCSLVLPAPFVRDAEVVMRAGSERLQLQRPTALTSLSLNGSIHLSWTDNAFQTAPGRFKWYRVYSTAYDLDQGLCDATWLLEGTTVAPEFLASAMNNGVPRCFGVSAVSLEGYESLWSPLRQDTPRPDARNLLVWAYDENAAQAGFRFWDDLNSDGLAQAPELGLVTDGARTDIDFWVYRDPSDSSLWIVPEFSGTRMRLYAPAPLFDLTSIDFAPVSGYSRNMIQAAPGYGYVFEIVEGPTLRYGALRVTHAGRDFVIFDWSFQTDPGNPELQLRGNLPTVSGTGSNVDDIQVTGHR